MVIKAPTVTIRMSIEIFILASTEYVTYIMLTFEEDILKRDLKLSSAIPKRRSMKDSAITWNDWIKKPKYERMECT